MKHMYEIAISEDEEDEKIPVHRTKSRIMHEIAFRVMQKQYGDHTIWTRLVEIKIQSKEGNWDEADRRWYEDQVLDAYEKGKEAGREEKEVLIEKLQNEIRKQDDELVRLREKADE